MAVQISGNDITVPRDTTVTRNLTVGGVLTYEDVTNVDSVGLVTARSGIEIGARPGVAASISVDGNMIISGISTFAGDVQLQSDLSIVDTIYHAGDTNTKIRFPSADTFTVETGGVQRLRIDSTGDVRFTGTNLTDSTNKNINLTVPSYDTDEEDVNIIQVENESSTNQISFGGGTSGLNAATKIRFLTASAANTVTGTERFSIASDGSSSFSGSVYMSNDNQILYLGAGNDLRLFHNGTTNQIYGNGSHDLLFSTNQTERVRILSTGEVGIGIDTPAKTGIQNNVKVLQIDGGDGAELILGNSTSSNVSVNHIGAIAFKNIDTSTGNAPHYAGIRCNCVDTSGNMNLKFYTGTTDFETDSPEMTINATGKVGINTVDALDTFQINQGALRMLSHAVGGGSGTHCHHLYFPVFMSSGTKQIATVSNFDSSTTCFAKIDYVTLYGYAGTNMGGGSRHAYLRRTNSDTAWRQINNSANGDSHGDNHHPNIFFTNNVLYVDIPGSVQLTGFMTVVASNCTLSRDVDITD